MMMTSRLSIAALALLTAPVFAQTSPASTESTPTPTLTPAPTPAQTPPPTPAPGSLGRLGGFALPSGNGQDRNATPPVDPRAGPDLAPVLRAPVPRPPAATETPGPSPRVTEPPRPAADRAVSRATPAPTAGAEPDTTPATARPTPQTPTLQAPADDAPAAGSTTADVPAPITPQQQSAPAATGDLAKAERGSGWLWWLVLAIIVAAIVAVIVIRRRKALLALPSPAATRVGATRPSPPIPAAPLPPPRAPVAPPATVGAQNRPVLQVDLRPTRAGLNLLSAVVEGEVIVRNDGDAPLEGLTLATALLSAHRDGDRDLAAFLSQPIGRPVTPPFTLAAGEERRVRLIAPLARGGIQPMEAGGRPIFVPIVATTCRFVCKGDEFHAARAFAIGVERTDSAKLAPIWLDTQPRMFDTVAARPHPLPPGLF